MQPADIHEHGHVHGHTHGENGDIGSPAASASVALDVGDGRGALIIYPDERFRGAEIEISAAAGDGRRVHTGVHERGTAAGSRLTAIFGSLAAGDYVVWADAQTAGGSVTVPDGAIAEFELV